MRWCHFVFVWERWECLCVCLCVWLALKLYISSLSAFVDLPLKKALGGKKNWPSYQHSPFIQIKTDWNLLPADSLTHICASHHFPLACSFSVHHCVCLTHTLFLDPESLICSLKMKIVYTSSVLQRKSGTNDGFTTDYSWHPSVLRAWGQGSVSDPESGDHLSAKQFRSHVQKAIMTLPD